MSENRIRLFTNGEMYRTWRWNNCARCVKDMNCPLEYEIASAAVLDGTIPADIAGRLGAPDDGREKWWCQEIEREAATAATAEGRR